MNLCGKSLLSEGYKFLHSWAVHLHWCIPILGVGIFLAYYRISLWSEVEKVESYLQILAITFPVLIAVIFAIVSEEEKQAGFFGNLRTSPCRKEALYLAKLVVLLLAGFLASLLAVLGFGIPFSLMGNRGFSTLFYLLAALLLFAGNIPLYGIQYIVSFSFPKGVGIGFGLVGSLLSALFLTGVGDDVWYYLPWGISARLCSLWAMGNAKNVPFSAWMGVKEGLLFMGLEIVLLAVFFWLWARNWETLSCDTES